MSKSRPRVTTCGKRIDTEPVGAVFLDDLLESMAVVEPIADLQVVEPIHMRAHLRRGRHLLDNPVDVIDTPAATGSRVLTTCIDLVRRCCQELPE